jgi:hypothetical protein
MVVGKTQDPNKFKVAPITGSDHPKWEFSMLIGRRERSKGNNISHFGQSENIVLLLSQIKEITLNDTDEVISNYYVGSVLSSVVSHIYNDICSKIVTEFNEIISQKKLDPKAIPLPEILFANLIRTVYDSRLIIPHPYKNDSEETVYSFYLKEALNGDKMTSDVPVIAFPSIDDINNSYPRFISRNFVLAKSFMDELEKHTLGRLERENILKHRIIVLLSSYTSKASIPVQVHDESAMKAKESMEEQKIGEVIENDSSMYEEVEITYITDDLSHLVESIKLESDEEPTKPDITLHESCAVSSNLLDPILTPEFYIDVRQALRACNINGFVFSEPHEEVLNAMASGSPIHIEPSVRSWFKFDIFFLIVSGVFAQYLEKYQKTLTNLFMSSRFDSGKNISGLVLDDSYIVNNQSIVEKFIINSKNVITSTETPKNVIQQENEPKSNPNKPLAVESSVNVWGEISGGGERFLLEWVYFYFVHENNGIFNESLFNKIMNPNDKIKTRRARLTFLVRDCICVNPALSTGQLFSLAKMYYKSEPNFRMSTANIHNAFNYLSNRIASYDPTFNLETYKKVNEERMLGLRNKIRIY